MENKKEIGRNIWELFFQNKSYAEIAKELGISKSVVSNIINYSLPANNWVEDNIVFYLQKENKLKEELNQMREELLTKSLQASEILKELSKTRENVSYLAIELKNKNKKIDELNKQLQKVEEQKNKMVTSLKNANSNLDKMQNLNKKLKTIIVTLILSNLILLFLVLK